MKLTVTKKKAQWADGSSLSIEIGAEVDVVGSIESAYEEASSFIDARLEAEFGDLPAPTKTTVKVTDDKASDAQVRLLARLGVDEAEAKAMTKKEASAKIDSLNTDAPSKPAPKQSYSKASSGGDPKPASKAQLRYLDNLGIKYDLDITKAEASKLIEDNTN